MKKRCTWASHPDYHVYHDSEWGKPNRDDKYLFEMLILEGAQAGLSFLTILRKRENYREALDNFNPQKIAKYNDKKIASLMKNAGIVRNNLKIKSTITNAKAFLQTQKEYGNFAKYLWSFTNNKVINNHIKSLKDIPTSTPLSDKISKDLKKRGFKFVGSTIVYAYLQAVGIINDHEVTCWCKNKK